jgi:hypothetical protein
VSVMASRHCFPRSGRVDCSRPESGPYFRALVSKNGIKAMQIGLRGKKLGLGVDAIHLCERKLVPYSSRRGPGSLRSYGETRS